MADPIADPLWSVRQLPEVLADELARAERRRASVVALFFGLLAVVGGAYTLIGGEALAALGSGAWLRFVAVGVVVAGIGYELAVRAIIDAAIAAGRRPPEAMAWINAGVEVSLPTVLTVVFTGAWLTPAEGLNGTVIWGYPLFIVLTALRLDWRVSVFAGGVAAVQYGIMAAAYRPWLTPDVAGTLFGTAPFYAIRPAFFAFTGLATGLVAREIRGRFLASLAVVEERNRVVGVFGRYLSDDVVDVILNSPEGLALGGGKRCVTLMMTDLRGFSAMSEELPPERVIAMLNHYLGAMTEVIVDHGGVIDEFIGDAIFVLFGAPIAGDDDADRAVACALAMQQRMEEVNAHNRAHGWPVLEMGIGINTGEVVLGNIGSEARSKYGVVGSQVNLTARIESYTVGGQVLVSASTHDAVRAPLEIADRFEVSPKGAREPVALYDVVAIGAPYDVSAPRPAAPVATLASPIAVAVRVMQGKDGGAEPIEGWFVALSRYEAELRIDASLPPHTNLKFDVPARDGLPGTQDLFGKVTAGGTEGSRVRFTGKGASAEAFLEAAVPAGSQGGAVDGG